VPIEQVGTEARTPADVVDACAARGLPTLSLTYSEPVVWWEFGHEIAVAAKDRGIDTVAITNGYIEREPLDRWCDVLRAIKVDFKAFTRRFYRDQCSGDLGPVLDTLVRIRERGVWLELVVLIVPTLNDDASEVGAMARWIVQQLGPDVPLHFTRFHPTYRLTELEPTPVSTLERCREIALEAGVHFVYTGNTPRHPGENTICPTSGEVLVERAGFSVIRNRIVDGRCPCCDRPVPGVW
jgi:pyruvate formate lyase activating enzyme